MGKFRDFERGEKSEMNCFLWLSFPMHCFSKLFC